MVFERLRAKRPKTTLAGLLLYELVRACFFALFLAVWRFRWTGGGRVPPTGALLIVANHQSYLDPPMVSFMCSVRHIDFVARGGLFDNPAFGRAISALHSIPIREDGGSEMAAIKEAIRRLGEGKAVLLFPEGARSEDGRMHTFQRGVAVLLKRAKCPVLPVGIEGPFDAWPRTRKLPRVFGARVGGAVGRAIPFEELMADGADAALRRLEREVDAMRLEARGRLRKASRGGWPPAGVGDLGFDEQHAEQMTGATPDPKGRRADAGG